MEQAKKYLKIFLNYVYFPFLIGGAIAKFAALRKDATTVDAAIDLANTFSYGPRLKGFNIHIKPGQVREEITAMLEVVRQEKPAVIVEIGTATGGSLFLWSQFAGSDATIISIDLPFGKYGAGYLSTKAKLLKSFARDRQTIGLISADSHEAATRKQLEKVLGGRKIDFLFIDGDHTYEGVKADFEDYKDLVRGGGTVAFHDIVTHDFDPSVGVPKFWQEVKAGYEHQEFAHGGLENGGGCGIGVLRLSK